LFDYITLHSILQSQHNENDPKHIPNVHFLVKQNIETRYYKNTKVTNHSVCIINDTNVNCTLNVEAKLSKQKRWCHSVIHKYLLLIKVSDS